MELSNTDAWYDENVGPSFSRIFYDHDSTPAYVPDTVNLKTASGGVIYSKTLKTVIASLDFIVKSWVANSSHIVGFQRPEWEYRYSNDDSTWTRILVASANTYQLLRPEATILPPAFSIPKSELPVISRGVGYSSDFKKMMFRKELIADDLHAQLISAYANRLSILPYECFVSSHSFRPNSTDLFIGIGPQQISIDDAGGRSNLFSIYDVSMMGLPEGATFL